MQNQTAPAALAPFINVCQMQLEASRQFATAMLDGTEKIDRVMLEATHRLFNRQLSLMQTAASAGDPQSAANLLQSGFLPGEDPFGWQKEVMRIFTDMQNEMGRSLQEYVQRLGGTASRSAESLQQSAAQFAPGAGGHGADYNPMAGMFSVWESAFKEAATLARNNMADAQAATKQMMSATAAEAGKFPGAGGDAPPTPAASGASSGEAAGPGGMAMGSEADERRGGGGKRK